MSESKRFVIPINPISVNKAWFGKHIKTSLYRQWSNDVLYLIPNDAKIEGWFVAEFTFYIKHFAASDADNFMKSTLDGLAKKGVIDDDRFCKKFTCEKVKVTNKSDEKIEVVLIPISMDKEKERVKLKDSITIF